MVKKTQENCEKMEERVGFWCYHFKKHILNCDKSKELNESVKLNIKR